MSFFYDKNNISALKLIKILRLVKVNKYLEKYQQALGEILNTTEQKVRLLGFVLCAFILVHIFSCFYIIFG